MSNQVSWHGKLWLRLEQVLIFVGIVMLATYLSIRLYSKASSQMALSRFHQMRAISAGQIPMPFDKQATGVDFSLWSMKRIQAYRDSLLSTTATPIAVLRIPRIRIEVPVFDGTDDLTLDRGVGRIIGTSKIDQMGNTGIAGHRDGFFRGLKDISQGDVLELITKDGTRRYVVQSFVVVQPEDIGVLANTQAPSLTLVTCFPFYFSGSAPQRFVVHASYSGFDGSTR
jgi:sortase A